MPKLWDSLENFNKRGNLIKAFILLCSLYVGALVNATYELIKWINLPYDNQRDIIILLERSQEYNSLFTNLDDILEILEESSKNRQEIILRLNQLENDQIELQILLERIDERTGGNRGR